MGMWSTVCVCECVRECMCVTNTAASASATTDASWTGLAYIQTPTHTHTQKYEKSLAQVQTCKCTHTKLHIETYAHTVAYTQANVFFHGTEIHPYMDAQVYKNSSRPHTHTHITHNMYFDLTGHRVNPELYCVKMNIRKPNILNQNV